MEQIINNRQEVRRLKVEDCLKRSLVILAEKEDILETIIERDMNYRNIEAFETDELTKWIPWKEELDQARFLFTFLRYKLGFFCIVS